MAFATEIPADEQGRTPLAHSEFRPVGEIARTGGRFEVVSPHQPAGDQPAAIDELERRIKAGSAMWCCWAPPVPVNRPPPLG